jgi:hypothetical protein
MLNSHQAWLDGLVSAKEPHSGFVPAFGRTRHVIRTTPLGQVS